MFGEWECIVDISYVWFDDIHKDVDLFIYYLFILMVANDVMSCLLCVPPPPIVMSLLQFHLSEGMRWMPKYV